jgi:outer membrane murein-binding lipoprotein Lpp
MRRLRWFLALLCGVLLLAGCTSGPDAGSEEAAVGGAAPAQDAAGGEAGADSDAGGEDRQVVTTADVTVIVDDPAIAADEVARLAETSGGRVDQRNERAAGVDGTESLPSAWLTVRVPADRLSTVLGDLEAVGEVRELSQESADVTTQARDLDARITALQTSVDRLLAIMADAKDTAALLATESEISGRQAELESLQSERAHLTDQVAMSTLRVNLVAEDAPVVVDAGGFLGGLRTGWDALVATVSGVLMALGVLLPWIVVVGAPLGAALWFVRRRRRSGGTLTPSSATADDGT